MVFEHLLVNFDPETWPCRDRRVSLFDLRLVLHQSPLPVWKTVVERFLDQKVRKRRVHLYSHSVLYGSEGVVECHIHAVGLRDRGDFPSDRYATHVCDISLHVVGYIVRDDIGGLFLGEDSLPYGYSHVSSFSVFPEPFKVVRMDWLFHE